VLEKGIEHRPDAPTRPGLFVSLADLASYLSFPDHEAVQAAGDAQQVTNCGNGLMLVQVAAHIIRWQAVWGGKDFGDLRAVGSGHGVDLGKVDLDTVACAEDNHLAAEPIAELSESLFEANPIEGQPLAQFDGCIAEAAANDKEDHGMRPPLGLTGS
jgi:hypothetical protein